MSVRRRLIAQGGSACEQCTVTSIELEQHKALEEWFRRLVCVVFMNVSS